MKKIKSARVKNYMENTNFKLSVSEIIEDVKRNKDEGIKVFNKMFDNNSRENFIVSKEEIEEAYKSVDEEFIKDIKVAASNIEAFAIEQKKSFQNDFSKEIYPGVILSQENIPLDSCLAYVPGGKYPLFSTALMLIIPAKVAGVKRVVACSPIMKNTDKINPKTLVAMDLAGADEIYAIGGAQAIAAFSYGSESISPVDKIVGPGNKYVTEAKRQCYGQVGIDFIAGPSEVLIIADNSANPTFVAADLLAQCEHDLYARAILITDSDIFAVRVGSELNNMLNDLPTRDIASKSWEDNGEIIIVDNIEYAIDISNDYAPEHLEVIVEDYSKFDDKLRNYGSLFIGNMSGEVFGDYVSGTNHTLPTLRAARYTGGVWVGSFIKTCTKQKLSSNGIENLGPIAENMAREEGLYAHALAAKVRVDYLNK